MVDGGLPFRAAMMDGEEGQRQAFFPEYYHGRPDGGALGGKELGSSDQAGRHH